MPALLIEPLRRNILAKTPRIHMRNAYQLQYIAKNANLNLSLKNTRTERNADLTDVFELMLLGVRPNDMLELKVHIEDGQEHNKPVNDVIADVEQALMTP